MRPSRGALSILTSIAAGATCALIPLTGAHADDGSAPASRAADYLNADPAIEASGSDQCGLAVSKRHGNWVCVDNPAASSAAQTSQAGSMAAEAVGSGFCSGVGCWYYTDDFHAHNDATGYFGYDSETIGSVKMDSYHTLNGAQMQTRASFTASVRTTDLQASGDLFHGSHTGTGDEVGGNYDLVGKDGALLKNTSWSPWDPKYYSSYDKDSLNHANVIEFAWGKYSYPGYWYLYQKSIIADDPNNNNIYGFNNAEYMFTSSVGSGYHGS